MSLEQRFFIIKKFPVKGKFPFKIPFEEITIAKCYSQKILGDIIGSLLNIEPPIYTTIKINLSTLIAIKNIIIKILPKDYDEEKDKPVVGFWGSYGSLYCLKEKIEEQLEKLIKDFKDHPLWELYYEAY